MPIGLGDFSQSFILVKAIPMCVKLTLNMPGYRKIKLCSGDMRLQCSPRGSGDFAS